MGIKTKNGVELSDEMLENIAEMFERGEIPGSQSRVVKGRPLLFGEDLQSITFKVPIGKVAALDSKAATLKMSRSDYLRHLIDNDLASARQDAIDEKMYSRFIPGARLARRGYLVELL